MMLDFNQDYLEQVDLFDPEFKKPEYLHLMISTDNPKLDPEEDIPNLNMFVL